MDITNDMLKLSKISPTKLRKKNSSREQNGKNLKTQSEEFKSLFGQYNLKPKKQDKSPLIYSTCQTVTNNCGIKNSAANGTLVNNGSPSFFLKRRILNDHKSFKPDEKDTPGNSKLIINISKEATLQRAEEQDEQKQSHTSLFRHTSFGDLKHKQKQAVKETEDFVNYTTIATTRTNANPEETTVKLLPPSHVSSSLDPTFKNLISGCAFNYCDSATAVLNQKTAKTKPTNGIYLKKSNSVASNQYFVQYIDKLSNKSIGKKLKEKKISKSSMDISGSISIPKKEDDTSNSSCQLNKPLVYKSEEEHRMAKFVYSFNLDTKLTKSSSTSFIDANNNGANSINNGVAYIKVDGPVSNNGNKIQTFESKVNSQIENKKIVPNIQDIPTQSSILDEKPAVKAEAPQPILITEKTDKEEKEKKQTTKVQQNLADRSTSEKSRDEEREEASNLKLEKDESSAVICLQEEEEANDNRGKEAVVVEVVEGDEKEISKPIGLEVIAENSNSATNEDKSEEVTVGSPRPATRMRFSLIKKTESFNIKHIGDSSKEYQIVRKKPHSLAPFIIKSRELFQKQQKQQQQEKQSQPPLACSASLKRNSSCPNKTMLRKNMSQFFDIKSKIQQFEQNIVNVNTSDSCYCSNNSTITSSVPGSQISVAKFNKQSNNENIVNLKVPEDFHSSVKVKQLKNIFETGNIACLTNNNNISTPNIVSPTKE